jgi:integrase
VAKPTKHYGKWRIRWIDEHGERHSEVYDDYRDAALKLRQHEVAIEEVRRGLRKPFPIDKTFDDLADYWLEKIVPNKRSARTMKSMIKRLRQTFGSIRLSEIGIEAVDDYVIDGEWQSDKTPANHITLLTSTLHAAMRFTPPWLAAMPKFNKPKVTLFSRDYSYLRTRDEIDRFLRAAREEGEHVFALYATAVYTGMRAGELAGLQWSDIDLDRRLITIQRSYTGPTKSDRVRYVPVLDPLLPILREWRLRHPGRLVFTNRDGNMLQPSGRIFQEVLHRVLDAAGLPLVERNGKLRPYIRFHDTRHTFASHWVLSGGDIFKLQKILGHQSIQMTQRYAHLAPDAFAVDYARLGTQAPSADPATLIEFAARSP